MGGNPRRWRFVLFAVVLAGIAAAPGFTQRPGSLLQIYPLGPLVGLYSASFEQVLSDESSIFVRTIYHNPQWALFRDLADYLYGVEGLRHEAYAAWRVKAIVGVSYFLGRAAPEGLFLGGGVALGYVAVRDDMTSPKQVAESLLVGGAVHAGYRLILGSIAISPRAELGGLFAFDDFRNIDEARLKEFGRGLDWDVGVDLAITF